MILKIDNVEQAVNSETIVNIVKDLIFISVNTRLTTLTSYYKHLSLKLIKLKIHLLIHFTDKNRFNKISFVNRQHTFEVSCEYMNKYSICITISMQNIVGFLLSRVYLFPAWDW